MRDLPCARCVGGEDKAHAGASGWLGTIVASCPSPATRAPAQSRGSIPAMGTAHAPCFAALAVAVGAILL